MKIKSSTRCRLAAVLPVLFLIIMTAGRITAQSSAEGGINPFNASSLVKKTASVAKLDAAKPSYEDFNSKLIRIATNERIPLRLILSLIKTESAFRPKAVSYKGAACLTQLMPSTARRFGLVVNASIDERFNTDKCLTAGARYLRLLLDMFKDVRLALAAYNAGEGAVIKFGNRIPPYKETIQYVEKISYLYYGESGHGTAFAYNYPLAVSYTNQLYAGRNNIAGRKLGALPNIPMDRTEPGKTKETINADIASTEPPPANEVKKSAITDNTPYRVYSGSLVSTPEIAKQSPNN